jgi:enoyl-CoA hydratase
MFETITWKIEDQIGHLVLAQPPANTMTRHFFDELHVLTSEVMPVSDFKALVVYGRGRHFSAGADPADLIARIGESLQPGEGSALPGFLAENISGFEYIASLEIPTYAAIRGACLGSALELALCCRYRICAEGTVFGFPETTFGLMPGCGGTVRLPGIAGHLKAVELILSGRNFTAEEAYAMGIVHRVMPRRAVVEEVVKLAGRVGSR